MSRKNKAVGPWKYAFFAHLILILIMYALFIFSVIMFGISLLHNHLATLAIGATSYFLSGFLLVSFIKWRYQRILTAPEFKKLYIRFIIIYIIIVLVSIALLAGSLYYYKHIDTSTLVSKIGNLYTILPSTALQFAIGLYAFYLGMVKANKLKVK